MTELKNRIMLIQFKPLGTETFPGRVKKHAILNRCHIIRAPNPLYNFTAGLLGKTAINFGMVSV
jgi:hypothetical protein